MTTTLWLIHCRSSLPVNTISILNTLTKSMIFHSWHFIQYILQLVIRLQRHQRERECVCAHYSRITIKGRKNECSWLQTSRPPGGAIMAAAAATHLSDIWGKLGHFHAFSFLLQKETNSNYCTHTHIWRKLYIVELETNHTTEVMQQRERQERSEPKRRRSEAIWKMRDANCYVSEKHLVLKRT